MDLDQYVQDATSTESVIESVNVDPKLLASTLQILIAGGSILDQIKKNAFYGRDFNRESLIAAFGFIVQSMDDLKDAIQNGPVPEPTTYSPRVFHSIVGIATEAVELLEGMNDENFDTVNFLEELGDLNWYEAIGIDAVGGTFEQVLTANIEKLSKSDKARYKDGFSADDANNRDLDAERTVLTDNLDVSNEGC